MADVVELGSIESLPVLQDAIKRDAASYKQDFEIQFAAFQTQCELFETCPQKPNREFDELLMFIAHTAGFYRLHQDTSRAEDFACIVLRLIHSSIATARPMHLKTLLASLILMDNKNQLDQKRLYAEFIGLLNVENADYSKFIIRQLIKGLARIKQQDQVRYWQKCLFDALRGSKVSMFCQRMNFILISLYLKGIWKDQKTANMIAEGIFHRCNKVIESSARFILGDLKRLHISVLDAGMDEDMDEDEMKRKQAELVQQLTKELTLSPNNKKKKSKKKMERLKEQAEKNLERLEGKVDERQGITFDIMDKIYDPHNFTERLFQRFSKPPKRMVDGVEAKDTFKIKLLCFTVAARLMGKYEVLIPGFLDFFTKYLNPRQDQITRILAILAQAVHTHMAPEEVQKCTKTIADVFVVDTVPSEALTVGLNTIREMCKRNPNAITPELLEDLLNYGKSNSATSVKIAANSLRNFYRLERPELLPKKYRGRPIAAQNAPQSHGGIEGIDILMRLKQLQRKRKCPEADDDETSMKMYGADRVLTERDFQMLKKIKLKSMTAKSMGLDLTEWLDANDAWKELAGIQDDAKSNSEIDIAEILEDEESSLQSEFGVDDEDTTVDGNDSKSVSGVSDDGSLSGESNDGSSTDESEREEVITGESLRGKQKLSRAKASLLQRMNKVEKRLLQKSERRDGKQKHRAGITNRVAARNKPMAMMRQKREHRDKQLRDVRSKVASLKAHVKTLKMQKRQRLRRR